jgi:hypothetical protein
MKQTFQVNWHAQEVVVKLHSMDWIEKLYFEQTLVNTNKNQEKSDGCEQVKRKNKKDAERSGGASGKMHT